MRSQLENVIKKRENTCTKWHYAILCIGCIDLFNRTWYDNKK